MVLTDKQIKEIADGLEAGMKCYYNRLTGNIKTIIDFDSWIGADDELWEDDLNEIDEHFCDYFVFENMYSHDSFNLMVDFVDLVSDSRIQTKLINALNQSKPFRNFKNVIDNSGECRQQWFDFKRSRYIEWVQDQIDTENSLCKNE
jgi:hypothetical protein